MKRPFRVGHSCQAWCTKCKSETEHTIVAMVGAIPKRVECCGCSSQHNYRLPPDLAAKKAAPRAKAAPGVRRPRPGSWQAQLASAAGTPLEYRISTTFEAGDYLEHPSLGRGIVQRVIPGGKIEVLFERGLSLLVHQR